MAFFISFVFCRYFLVNWRRSVGSSSLSPSPNICQLCTSNLMFHCSKKTSCACHPSQELPLMQSSPCSMNPKVAQNPILSPHVLSILQIIIYMFLPPQSLAWRFLSISQVRSCLVWTPSIRCSGSNCWKRCFWACPVSTRGPTRWCFFSTSSMGHCCFTQRTAPFSGSTQPPLLTLLFTSTISSLWAVTSGSCQQCCRYR